MAKARSFVKRRKAIRNLRKITRTMNLIATVRYQKTVKRMQAFRPYAIRVRQIVYELLAGVPDISHPLLKTHPSGTGRVALIVLSSERGLCGAYNSNVFRAAVKYATDHTAAGRKVELYVVGKKGVSYFSKQHWPVVEKYESPAGQGVPAYEVVRKFAQRMMEKYAEGIYDEVSLATDRFISAGRQTTEVLQFFPIPVERLKGPIGPAAVTAAGLPPVGKPVAYETMPDPQTLLDEWVPKAVYVSMFQAVLEAATAEQFIRMVSMKSATDNADRLIKELTTKYNRARQSQITTELCEILGAVEAMK
jgi:F-type H+-transporting ATPase subunit gamma